jgi:DNA polymerase-1
MPILQEPLFLPNSSWTPPAVFPTFGPVIALDTETRDPYLKQTGPSFKRGEGEVVGISIADKVSQVYLPIAHQGGGNLAKNLVISYVRSIVSASQEVLMHNAMYDMGWLRTLDIEVPAIVRDVRVADTLIDENLGVYSLDAIALRRLDEGKREDGLNAVADAYKLANGKKKFNPKSDMWRLHSRFVGQYAEADARLTFDIYQLQKPELRKQGLWKLWEMECQVTKVLDYMTMKGIPVDTEAAEQLRDEMWAAEQKIKVRHAGVNLESSYELADYLKTKGIRTPKTKKGNPSVKNEWLEAQTDPLIQEIAQARQLRKIRSDYIENTILGDHCYGGRIHGSFKQTATEDGGTVTGRLSSSDPNLQQIPARSSWGKRVRTLYVAEPDCLLGKADYSAQEPRLQVHYALLQKLAGSQEALDAFLAGIKMYTFFEKATGLPYATCKMLCLGIAYGMQSKTMSEKLGVSKDDCDRIMDNFDQKAPFLRQLFEATQRVAKKRGYIRTIMGRRARFDLWDAGWDQENNRPSKSYTLEEAREKYGNIQLNRSYTYKALNRLVQGSAGDMSKLAMVRAYEAGLDIRLPVHDEIVANIESPEQGHQLGQIMKDAGTELGCLVPMEVDVDIGKTWGG